MNNLDQMLGDMAETERKVSYIREKFPHVEWPDVSAEPVHYGRRQHTPILNARAIVNTKNQTHYAFVSDQYKLVPHECVLYNMLDVIDGMPEFGEPEVKIALSSEGGKARFDLHFPSIKDEISRLNGGVDKKVGDLVSMKVSGMTSYDTSWAQSSILGAERLACTNGMVSTESISHFKSRHTMVLNQKEFMETLRVGMETFTEQTAIWKSWAERTLTAGEYEAAWGALPFSEQQRQKIQELPEAVTKRPLVDYIPTESVNQWFFHNVVTQFVTHEMASEVRRAEIEPKIARVFHDM